MSAELIDRLNTVLNTTVYPAFFPQDYVDKQPPEAYNPFTPQSLTPPPSANPFGQGYYPSYPVHYPPPSNQQNKSLY